MMRRGFNGVLVSMGAIAVALPLPAVALCPAELANVIDNVAARPELARARLGVQVETLAGEVILSREGDRFFVPASTMKLLTTAAALTYLGPAHRLQTTVLGVVDPLAGGDRALLQVVGGGDPSIDQTDLEALAHQVRQRSVQGVTVLYGRETFAGQAVNPNWDWEDVQAGYGAPVNSLIFQENEIGLSLHPQSVGAPLQVVWDDPTRSGDWVIENDTRTVAPGTPEFIRVGRDLGQPVLRVGGQLIVGSAPETASIAEPNPGPAFLNAFAETLGTQGITVQQTSLGEVPRDRDWQLLASVESPPLAELLVSTNQNSNNLYAEALLKTLGRQRLEAPDATAAGIAIALETLETLGLDPQSVVMVDGSGLARKNLITPDAIVQVLQGMARSPYADDYRASLAIAGDRGTLRSRLQETPAAGRLYGKSGAISRNFALAGYLELEDYPPLAFGIFINNIDQRGSVARALIDEIVVAISQLPQCEIGAAP